MYTLKKYHELGKIASVDTKKFIILNMEQKSILKTNVSDRN